MKRQFRKVPVMTASRIESPRLDLLIADELRCTIENYRYDCSEEDIYDIAWEHVYDVINEIQPEEWPEYQDKVDTQEFKEYVYDKLREMWY